MRDYRQLMIDDIISMEATPEAEVAKARTTLAGLSDEALGERLRTLVGPVPPAPPALERLGLRIVMMGPPGSGKGTQAVRIAERFEVPHLSTGNLLREAVANDTEVGRRIAQRMTTGELIDDATVVEVAHARLAERDCWRGFVLDGYPRTVPQAEALTRFLSDRGLRLDAVIDLDVDESRLLERVEARVVAARAKGEPVRADDTAEVLAARMSAYRELTAPLTARYAEASGYRVIDGNRPIPEVTASIEAVLDKIHAEATRRRDAMSTSLERMIRGGMGGGPAPEVTLQIDTRSRFSPLLAFALGAAAAAAVFAIRTWLT